MATDESPPRVKLIAAVAATVVLSLGGLKFAFDSYFIALTEEAAAEKRAAPAQLLKVRAEEQKNLTTSPVSITAAMSEISRGRTEVGGPELIRPNPSDDLGPMTGWTRSPRKFEIPPKPVTDIDAILDIPGDAGVLSAGDGGAAMVSDGGAARTVGDAGAPHMQQQPHQPQHPF